MTKSGEVTDYAVSPNKACKLLGMTDVRCEVIEGTEQNKLLIMAIENLQRKDLSIVEEGQIYNGLTTALLLSQNKLSKQLGVPQQRINYAINAYLKLTPEVQQMVQNKE